MDYKYYFDYDHIPLTVLEWPSSSNGRMSPQISRKRERQKGSID